MATAPQKRALLRTNPQAVEHKALSTKHKPRPKRSYFDVGIGSVCLSGEDTGGAYCLLEVALAPGMGVPRHTHTREDKSYFVRAGELEVIVGDKTFVLKPGDSLVAPRDIPHQLRNSGFVKNQYLLIFWPSGFEGFWEATAVPALDNEVAPTEPPAAAIRNVHELAGSLGRAWAAELEYRRIPVNAVNPGPLDSSDGLNRLHASTAVDKHRSKIPSKSGQNRRLGAAQQVAETVVFLVSEDRSPITETELSVENIPPFEDFPLGRLGTPEEIAKAVVFLASDASSHITDKELFVGAGFAQL